MTRRLLSTLLTVTFTTFILSCSKEDTKPIDNKKIILIQQHTWILDSTNTITDSFNEMQAEIPTSPCNFYADSMILNFHGTNLISYGVFYQAPDKVYIWLPGEIKNENEYFIINTVDSMHLIGSEIDILSSRTRVRYFHAQ